MSGWSACFQISKMGQCIVCFALACHKLMLIALVEHCCRRPNDPQVHFCTLLARLRQDSFQALYGSTAFEPHARHIACSVVCKLHAFNIQSRHCWLTMEWSRQSTSGASQPACCFGHCVEAADALGAYWNFVLFRFRGLSGRNHSRSFNDCRERERETLHACSSLV